MIERFFPDEYVDSINHIDYDDLLKKGIKNLIFDIDNTIEPYDIPKPSSKNMDLLSRLKGMGFAVLLVSNNSKSRVDKFNEELKLPAKFRARKPFRKAVREVMREAQAMTDNTVFIGDQVFTDIWCARRLGIYAILVKPIATRDEFSVRLKRGIERKIIDKYLRTRGQ
ncbi:MAG: YqeG family HAD IIIA-type phosphatase [Defluviitaleaceae bacterium]|nr:YqeG family HAD IIIA-type phosphatase [Defluviitaleaceae bacterium]